MAVLGSIPQLRHSAAGHFLLMAGPCVIENDQTPFEIATELVAISERLKVPFVFKGSYRKANRSRLDSFSGIGDVEALEILAEVGRRFEIPVVTDIHSEPEAELAASYVDILQIPAFLCRQTTLLQAAAKTGKWVNIKKGQFLSADSMSFAVEKVKASGNEQVMVTERGTTFGYQDLVVDFRGFPTLRSLAPLILDCTHSLQRPNQSAGVTGGNPELIRTIAKAGAGAGLDGLFIETHPRPHEALSDGANMLPMNELESLLTTTLAIHKAQRL